MMKHVLLGASTSTSVIHHMDLYCSWKLTHTLGAVITHLSPSSWNEKMSCKILMKDNSSWTTRLHAVRCLLQSSGAILCKWSMLFKGKEKKRQRKTHQNSSDFGYDMPNIIKQPAAFFTFFFVIWFQSGRDFHAVKTSLASFGRVYPRLQFHITAYQSWLIR